MKLFPKVLLFFLIAILGLFCIYLLVVRFVPSFGGDLTTDQKQAFSRLENFNSGTFVNRSSVPEKLSFSKFLELGYIYFTTKVEHGSPSSPIKPLRVDPASLNNFKGTRLFWFGHSAFLVQHQGKNILLDPMFGQVPAPLDFLGGKRFSDALPIRPEDLPEIDYVLFSHDHYDHLDYGSVLQLKDKVKWFLTPLGLGNHLLRWGVSAEKIIELNWWEAQQLEDFNFVCTPAQHFSGRKFSNSQQTLWSSWVIQSDTLNLYFSGDSGYDNHFKAIGEQYGPFDLALIECGQYNKMWPDVHLFPEETVQAGMDLQAQKIIPIHWGAFKLALHAWNEPVKRALTAAEKKEVKIEVPKIGQEITLDSVSKAVEPWFIED